MCCGKDRSKVISHTSDGYSHRCFRCGDGGFVKHGVRSVSEMLQHRKELDQYMNERGDLALPDDFTLDMPNEALGWFLRYGISSAMCKHYQFGYSESLGRAVMPVFDLDGRLRMTVSRALYKDQQPKYKNKKDGDPSTTAFYSDDEFLLREPLKGTVITEDILSAGRAGRVLPAVSTLGTYLSDKLAVRLSTGLDAPFYIWYDGDAAGIKGARQAKRTLDLLGIENYNVRTDLDPKEYNNDQIINFIKGTER